MISQTPVPAFCLGTDILAETLTGCAAVSDGPSTLIVVDAFWVSQPVFQQVLSVVPGSVAVFEQFAGEPKVAHIEAALQDARAMDATLIIGMGGGSALDIAKMVSLCLAGDHGPLHYALGANPTPRKAIDLIQVPTTAGTGSEANGTAVFSNAEGVKLWAYGTALKPNLAILDGGLLRTLPANLQAWCGMDALIHAFEAGTNASANPVNTGNAVRAIELIWPALPRAVKGDPQALEDLLLGSFIAGHAIENSGAAIAHCASHAIARFGPIHHGFATALAFEVTLPRVIAVPSPALTRVADAFNVRPDGLPAAITALMDQLEIERVLPAAFDAVSAEDLATEMQAEANAPMRNAATFETPEPVLRDIAGSLLSYQSRDHAYD